MAFPSAFSAPEAVALLILAIAACVPCQRIQASEPRPFANHVRFVPAGPTTFNILYESGPLASSSGLPSLSQPPLLGWDENVIATIEAGGGPPTLDETTLVATLPVLDTLISIARDDKDQEIGRVELLAVGNQKLDLNADNAIVDELAGTIAIQFGGPLLNGQPSSEFSVVHASGIYTSDVQLVEEGLVAYAGGKFLLPLDADSTTSLQENLLNAFTGGQIVAIDVVGVWTGQYVPEPSTGLLMTTAAVAVLACRKRRSRLLI